MMTTSHCASDASTNNLEEGTVGKVAQGKDVDMGLDVDALRGSFDALRPKADELMDVFYGMLFERYPSVKPLFANTDMREQKKKLFQALAMVVAHVEEPHVLSDTLRRLGARHVDYGALPGHYDAVGECLLHAMATVAGDAWTPSLEQQWSEASGHVRELMLQGAEERMAQEVG